MKNSFLEVLIFGVTALVFGGSCASYKIKPISAKDVKKWTQKGPGYVIYQPELYFAATATTTTSTNADKSSVTKEDITVAPVYLPNIAKPYQITTRNFLAKADFTFAFENGWKLTQISDKSDNSTVANTLAGQLQTMLKAAGVGVAAETAAKTRVFLYKPEYDEDGYITNFSAKGVIELGKQMTNAPGAPTH